MCCVSCDIKRNNGIKSMFLYYCTIKRDNKKKLFKSFVSNQQWNVKCSFHTRKKNIQCNFTQIEPIYVWENKTQTNDISFTCLVGPKKTRKHGLLWFLCPGIQCNFNGILMHSHDWLQYRWVPLYSYMLNSKLKIGRSLFKIPFQFRVLILMPNSNFGFFTRF